MNKVLLVIRLRYGHFVQVPLDETRARAIFQKWANGEYKMGNERPYVAMSDASGGWGVDMTEVIAVTLEPLPKEFSTINSGVQFPWKS